MKNKQLPILIIVSLVALGLGGLAGWLIRTGQAPEGTSVTFVGEAPTTIQAVAGEVADIKTGDVFGSPDESTFKDNASGYLAEAPEGSEGSHQLLRLGGVSQTVTLTSSVTDLGKLVGMDVEIWGETFAGQKAGWLMDVGRVKVVNPQGTDPSVEAK